MHLPKGTVTHLFTDLEGSTTLLRILGDARYADALRNHQHLLRTAVKTHGGVEVAWRGDGFAFAFNSARNATLAALNSQRAVAEYVWPERRPFRARMGLHTGETVPSIDGYIGLDVHRAARICEAGWGGQILLSSTTAELLKHEPPNGVGLQDLGEHRLKGLEPERLYQLLHAELPEAFPPLRSATVEPHNLPRQLTSFVGREHEMAELRQVLSVQRLVTIIGPPGCGKTRLAAEIAEPLVPEYPDGVRLVELARVSDTSLVVEQVASILGLRETSAYQMPADLDQPVRSLLESLIDYLRHRELLLVLDNCEHVIHRCALLADALVRHCPQVRVIATSQEALGVTGEQLYALAPLQAPDPTLVASVDELLRFPAVQLFAERAAAAVPHFRLTAQNAPAVAQICYRLDGIPLAIELVAPRLRLLSAEQIAARLDDVFRLAAGGSRTALPRHQTLCSALDWTYGLLAPAEQALLSRLSVFQGGFTLEAAEEISEGSPIDSHYVLSLLANLEAKGLLLVDTRTEEFRYRLLETIRSYGLQRLQDANETATVRERHRDWFLRLSKRAEPELHGPHQAVWFRRLTTEHHNLRGALQWSLERREAVPALELVSALWWFWYVRGFLSEARMWSSLALSVADGVSPGLRALVMAKTTLLAWAQADYDVAKTLGEEGLALAKASADRHAEGYATGMLGMVAHRLRDYDAAATLYGRALATLKGVGDSWSAAVVLLFLGRVMLHRGDIEGADLLFREGLALSQTLRDGWSISHYLYESGVAARRRGDLDQAMALLQGSLTHFQDVGSKEDMAYAHNMLGRTAYAAGDFTRAAAYHEESLSLARETGDRAVMTYALYHAARALQRMQDPRAAALYRQSLALRLELQDVRGATDCLVGLAQLDWAAGRSVKAMRLMGAAQRLRESAGGGKRDTQRDAEGGDFGAMREALQQLPLAQAWAEGQAMTLEAIAIYTQ